MGSGDSQSGFDERLRAEALRLSAEIARLEAARVRLAAEVDIRCKMDVLGYRSTKMWVAGNTLLEVGAAGRLIALGHALVPDIAGACGVDRGVL